MSLLQRAIDSMEGSGSLHIKTLNAMLDDTLAKELKMEPGPCVVLGLRDTGPGMDPEDSAHIFEPLPPGRTLGKRSGLGLSIVYGIMRNHDGAVQVASLAGRGSTFTLYSPRGYESLAVSPRIAAEAPVPAGTASGTILIIDDEETVLEFLSEALGHAGYRIFQARDGMEGVRITEEKKGEIVIVLLDAVLPRMGGREAFAKLRELNPSLQVILMSGYGVEDDVEAILSAGATAFLPKPFLLNEMISKIDQAIRSKDRPEAAGPTRTSGSTAPAT